jgi:hypothetical protein
MSKDAETDYEPGADTLVTCHPRLHQLARGPPPLVAAR